MELGIAVSVIANFLIVAGLIAYGLRLFADYHARGRWAKNMTALLAGSGMLTLAFALVITPDNAAVILLIARTKAHMVFLVASTILLLAAICAFGIITYWKPGRLHRERQIEKGLQDELPKIQ
jgi:hypothetical protein